LRYADKLLLFIAHDESSSGWVCNILQQLSGEGRRIPVKTDIVNAPGLEGAAVFFPGHISFDQDLEIFLFSVSHRIIAPSPQSMRHLRRLLNCIGGDARAITTEYSF
jgi:hypothetical protein